MPSEVRCGGCRHWFPSDQYGCERCGWERPAWNRHLHVANLNGHLFKQAEAAEADERSFRQSVAEEYRMCKRYGVEPGRVPSRKQVMSELSAPAAV